MKSIIQSVRLSRNGLNMAKNKRKLKHKRIWLDPCNPDVMSWASYNEEEYSDPGELTIQIADCHRVIALTLMSKADLKKIEKLIALLDDARCLYILENS